MYNLIMMGIDTEWDVEPGVVHDASFPLSRFLEYTDPDVERRFTPVSDSTLAYLARIPTLFTSELRARGDEPREEYVRMRLGKIANPRVVGRDIVYSFSIDIDVGEVLVDDREAFEKAFDLGRWELTRTHWAVKAGRLADAMAKIVVPRQDDPLPESVSAPPPPPPDAPPLPQNPVITSLQDFMAYVLGLQTTPGEEVFYRGHSDHRYRLEPSLFRRNTNGEFRYRPNEETLIRELLTAQATEFSDDKYMLDQLVRMQHYGLPTRLLDVTSNPLVALYFCCATQKTDTEGQEIEGEVIILTTPSTEVKFFDSDKVSCITNLCLMTDEEKNRMDTSMSLEDFNLSDDTRKLLHFIRREKPYFEGRIVPTDLERILFVRGRRTNERISSQSGAFLLFGKDSILPESGHSTLNVSRVTIRNKAALLSQLDKLNIKSSTVYPGIEKAAAEIAKKHEVRSSSA